MDNKLQELINFSPCPVIFGDTHSDYLGAYYPTQDRIHILSSISPETQFAVLTHEIQHAKCRRDDCYCQQYPVNHHVPEFHAYWGELIGCFDNIPALRISVRDIKLRAGKDDSLGHAKACQLLITADIWQKAKRLIGQWTFPQKFSLT